MRLKLSLFTSPRWPRRIPQFSSPERLVRERSSSRVPFTSAHGGRAGHLAVGIVPPYHRHFWRRNYLVMRKARPLAGSKGVSAVSSLPEGVPTSYPSSAVFLA